MRRKRTVIFLLSVMTGLLLLCIAVVAGAVAAMFSIAMHQFIAIISVIALLNANFILSIFVTNWYYNAFTRIWYTASAAWIGFFVYAFFASVLFWIIRAIFPAFNLSGALFIAAALVSAYGIVHAKRIVVTKIDAILPRLPASWNGKTAVWISDLHLGQIHGPAFARNVVTRVMELSPDLVFIGGDLYDGNGAGDIPELTEPLRELRAPQGVYFITGNHEEYGHRLEFISAVTRAGMRVLDDEIAEIDGLQLIGVDYQRASDAERFAEILSKLPIDPAKPSILLKHEPKDLDVAERAGISMQISGHTHRAQMWPLEYIARRAYKGFAYGLRLFGHMQVYTSSGVGTWGPPLRVGTDSEIVHITFK